MTSSTRPTSPSVYSIRASMALAGGSNDSTRPSALPPGVFKPQEADVAAFPNWVFAVVQIELMLPPAPINNAADASATKAINSVYSIKSWPLSSKRNVRMMCFMGNMLGRMAGGAKVDGS